MARLMTQKAAALYDAGDDMGAGEAANMAKYAAAEAACDAADRAVQTHGGNGITQEYGMAGLLVATRAGRIAPVSREMILNFVAMHSLGLPKSLLSHADRAGSGLPAMRDSAFAVRVGGVASRHCRRHDADAERTQLVPSSPVTCTWPAAARSRSRRTTHRPAATSVGLHARATATSARSTPSATTSWRRCWPSTSATR